MKPATIQAIFATIPKTITYTAPDGTTSEKTVQVEDARQARVEDMIGTADIALTFRFMDDRPSTATPTNLLLARSIEEGDIILTKGEITMATMSVNVYARAGGEPPGEDLVDQTMEALILWTRRDLTQATSVRGRGPVHDLTYLQEGLARRQMDVILEAPTTYQETVGTIDEEVITLEVQ